MFSRCCRIYSTTAPFISVARELLGGSARGPLKWSEALVCILSERTFFVWVSSLGNSQWNLRKRLHIPTIQNHTR